MAGNRNHSGFWTVEVLVLPVVASVRSIAQPSFSISLITSRTFTSLIPCGQRSNRQPHETAPRRVAARNTLRGAPKDCTSPWMASIRSAYMPCRLISSIAYKSIVEQGIRANPRGIKGESGAIQGVARILPSTFLSIIGSAKK